MCHTTRCRLPDAPPPPQDSPPSARQHPSLQEWHGPREQGRGHGHPGGHPPTAGPAPTGLRPSVRTAPPSSEVSGFSQTLVPPARRSRGPDHGGRCDHSLEKTFRNLFTVYFLHLRATCPWGTWERAGGCFRVATAWWPWTSSVPGLWGGVAFIGGGCFFCRMIKLMRVPQSRAARRRRGTPHSRG